MHGGNKCKAKTRSGKQCGNWSILGASVCRMHGGAAPQVKRRAKERLALADITEDRTILEIARIAYSDFGGFYREDGNLKPINELTEDQRAVLSGHEVIIKNAEAGDGHTDTIHKFKTWDKPKMLEALAKHFGLLNERIDHSGEIQIRWLSDDE